ncbi:MAG TPA: cyanophycin synthetase [Nannocystaceae bacterium]|nr:cyanophycin synthetase [Nannocystaceae bacterium]
MSDPLAALFDRRSLGIRLGLETMTAMWARVGRPCAGVPAIHVVGTNGKGSTSASCAHALHRHGRHVGLYTSPHLHRVGERVRIDGVAESDDALADAVARVLAEEGRAALPRPLSFFELLTLAAWLRFAAHGVDTIVAEAGMGGRYDATRICDAAVVVVTSIDLDHRQFLGDTIAAIAGEKIAVARAGVPCFTCAQPAEAMAVIREHTSAIGAPLHVVAPLARAPWGLPGEHQRSNAALALAAARVLVPAVQPEDLDDVAWPGRFERIAHGGGVLVLDVAHNPAGARVLADALREHGLADAQQIVGCMADKDVAGIVAAIGARSFAWVELAAFGSAGAPAPAGAAIVLRDAEQLRAHVDAALARGETVCVWGSHVLVAAVRAWALGLPAAQPGERG